MSKAPSRSAWREARRRDARAHLLAIAWEMVRADGLGGLSLRELARRAGITTPTVYAYFESKNAIYDAMFAEAAQSFAESKAELFQADDPQKNLVDRRTALRRVLHVRRRSVSAAVPASDSGIHAVTGGVRAGRSGPRPHPRAARPQPHHQPRELDIWTALMTG